MAEGLTFPARSMRRWPLLVVHRVTGLRLREAGMGRAPGLVTLDSHTLFSPSLCSLVGEVLSWLPSGGACLEAGLGLLLVEGRRLADCRTASECSRAFMRRAATLAVRLLWQP